MGVKCRQLKTSTFQTLVVQEKAITIPTQYFYTLPVFANKSNLSKIVYIMI